MKKNKPLAETIRPKSIDNIVGQGHLLSSDSLITKMIENKKIYSLIFYGPPGIGKTTMALAMCNDLQVPYAIFECSIDSKQKLLELIDLAKHSDKYVIIFEEIHRLNKDKQDILLPYIEKGIVNIFCTTTENPYFVVNPAIRSRCQILELKPLHSSDMYTYLKKLIDKKEIQLLISDDLLKKLTKYTNGDFRSTINLIDLLVNLYGGKKITSEILNQVIQNKFIIASHYGDAHYDLLSAFHKSLRGSDPDAAIYYLAQLLVQGDFKSLDRRLIACVYEDVGLANPQLCSRVVSAVHAAEIVGFPENKQIYANAVIEICLSPKSNSAICAINEALNDVESGKIYPIPNHIKDNNYKSSVKLNHKGYKYPHNYGGYVDQQYLPNELKNKKYYKSLKNGIEEKLNSWIKLFFSKK